MEPEDFDPHVLGSGVGAAPAWYVNSVDGGGLSYNDLQQAVTTTTTTWDGNTTITPGHLHTLQEGPYYTYSEEPRPNKECIKEAVREVLAELAAQDKSFTAWLKIKYMTIPVIPEGGNDDQVAKETVGEAR